MLSRLLGINDAESVNYFDWYLRHPWPAAVVILLLAAAVFYVGWLYWREAGLTRPRRITLGAIRAVVLCSIILMLFEPAFGVEATVRVRRVILVLVDRSDSMRQIDNRENREDREDAAVALGKARFDNISTVLLEPHLNDINNATRLALAQSLITSPQVGVFDQLAGENIVRYFTFNHRLDPVSGEGSALLPAMDKPSDFDRRTAMGSAIDEAVRRYTGQPIGGVVIITDGSSNTGLEPLEVASRLKDRNIPIYSVGIGLADPPDARVQDLIVQDTAFAHDKLPVTVRVESAGYDGHRPHLVLAIDGVQLQRRAITLTGRPQFEEFTVIPDRAAGAARLTATLTSLPGEASLENNASSRTINVIDEKIRVLYVEGKPRWEFRYLRAVLLRDRRLDVKFLMTQGDADLARHSPQYIDRFPDDASAFNFDMVIIGDVPYTYFTPSQVDRMRRLVAEQGGSLLMLAGRKYAPMTYTGTELGRMLPVELTRDAPITISNDAHPVATPQGLASAAVALEGSTQHNAAIWSLVRPMHQVPAIRSIKPGAMVLAELSEQVGMLRDRYPLIVWHRHGTGKVMMINSDQLWRLRFKQGDQYHARFWGQTIQFMTLSRLLGGNRRIVIETDRRHYQTGDRVQVFAKVLNQAYEPVNASHYGVTVERDGERGIRESSALRLEAVPDAAGVFQGFYTIEQDGRYAIRAPMDDRAAASAPEFQAVTTEPEMRDPRMQEVLLRKMSELSGGRFIPVRELNTLPELIGQDKKTATVRLEKELWDLPAVFLGLVLLAGMEWFVRRRSNLV
jgi:hypothetical protein